MMQPRTVVLALVAATSLAVSVGCNPQSGAPQPRVTIFVGVDTSGSFRSSGSYDDSLRFLAHYIYGHLNALGDLAPPRALFVAPLGCNDFDEPKAFHPIHDFEGKNVEEIEAACGSGTGPATRSPISMPFSLRSSGS